MAPDFRAGARRAAEGPVRGTRCTRVASGMCRGARIPSSPLSAGGARRAPGSGSRGPGWSVGVRHRGGGIAAVKHRRSLLLRPSRLGPQRPPAFLRRLPLPVFAGCDRFCGGASGGAADGVGAQGGRRSPGPPVRRASRGPRCRGFGLLAARARDRRRGLPGRPRWCEPCFRAGRRQTRRRRSGRVSEGRGEAWVVGCVWRHRDQVQKLRRVVVGANDPLVSCVRKSRGGGS